MWMVCGGAVAAPQTFNTALPVARDTFVFREQLIYRRAMDDPSSADRALDVRGGISVLGYGVRPDLAVFAVLPWVDKSLEVATPGGRQTRGGSGLGDARLFGRYTLYQHDARGRTLRIAPFLGVELPTGGDDDRDGLGPVPRPLQLGSGSWDGLAGLVLSYQTLNYEVDAQMSYKLNTRARGFEFGDEFRLDASLQHRLWPRELASRGSGFLYAVVEGNFLRAQNNESRGREDPNSGGKSLFVSPGLQYVRKRWIVEAIVQLPVVQELNGTALEDDFTVRAGVRFNF